MNIKIVERLILPIIAILLTINSSNVYASVTDSIGTEVVNGKIIILHKVEPKETLYSIHNKYKVPVASIIAMNPGSDVGLSIGQVLKIPTERKATTSVSTSKANTSKNSTVGAKFHTVKPGETLYGVSKMYPSSVEDIMKWNNLKSSALSIGQKIQVSAGTPVKENTTTASTVKPKEEVNEVKKEAINEEVTTPKKETSEIKQEPVEKVKEDKEEIKKEETIEDNAMANASTDENKEEKDKKEHHKKEKKHENEEEGTDGSVEKIDTENEDEPIKEKKHHKNHHKEKGKLVEAIMDKEPHYLPQDYKTDSIPATKVVDMDGYKKVFEKGYAELLPNTESDQRYLAHHRTLPEGTILQVKNLANGKSVFVRVVGTFESDDPKLIIKLSSRAEIRLQSEAPKFLTEISYIP